jgi:hypothetical protein
MLEESPKVETEDKTTMFFLEHNLLPMKRINVSLMFFISKFPLVDYMCNREKNKEKFSEFSKKESALV